MFGVIFTNGLIFGFEFSLKYKLFQLHLGFISLIVIWAIDDEEEETG